jgi:hypothetical protein
MSQPQTNTQPDQQQAPTPLQQWLAAVAKDARKDPAAYLKETIVPEGGE